MEILIKRKQIELTKSKLGAVYRTDPKIVVVEMIKRPLRFPEDSIMSGVLALRSKFNSMLNDAADHFKFNRLYVEKCMFEFQFDRMSNLNSQGMADFWKEVDGLIEQFDVHKIKLLPRIDEWERCDYLKKSKGHHKIRDRY